MPPSEHLVDSAYIDAELLVNSREQHDIDLIGPARSNNSWQSKVDGAYDLEKFAIDWEKQSVQCPQGNQSSNCRY